MSRDLEQTSSDRLLGGRYQIQSKLGAGGFGQTFLAQDLHLPGHPFCVVKKLKPQTSDVKSLSMARRLFEIEATVLYQLGNHDQIPRLFAHFEDNQEFYLVQELIEGESLSQELVSGHAWSEVRTIALLQDVLQVLTFVHDQQVIHRDLKPPNLIRRKQDGKIVLIDFGAVKQVSTQITNPETQTDLTISIGTKGYMPNEQLAGNPRFSSDVYAVGMLGIQAVTGVNPKRLPENVKTGEIDWRDKAPHVSLELADILECMVRYDFRDRYPSATEALEALKNLPALLKETEYSPLPQPLSEAREAHSSQELPPLYSGTQSTESEIDPEPTNIWMPVKPSETSSTSAASTDLTEPLSQQELQQPLTSAARTKVILRLVQQWLVKFWSIFAILAAVGATFWITKILLSPQATDKIAHRKSTPTQTPTPSATTKPKTTPTPSPPAHKLEPSELQSKAERLRQAGEYEQAIKLYDQAIALKPNAPQAYWGRCYSLNKLKEPDQALVSCNDALDLNPNYAEALWSKGNIFEQQNLQLQALQLYERATELKPKLAEAWVDYGVALQGFGRSEEAIVALDKGITLQRNSAKAWLTKGEALLNMGRFEKAIASLDKALQLQPNNSDALKLRKKAQEQLGH